MIKILNIHISRQVLFVFLPACLKALTAVNEKFVIFQTGHFLHFFDEGVVQQLGCRWTLHRINVTVMCKVYAFPVCT